MGFQSKHILEDDGYPELNHSINKTVLNIRHILNKYKNKKLTDELIQTILSDLRLLYRR